MLWFGFILEKMVRNVVFYLVIVVLLDYEILALEKVSRQKRCIVIQKQTGGKADSGEGSDDEDYDFKRPEPKAPLPDRLRNDKSDGFLRKNDVETIPPELLKYKAPSKAMYKRLRMKNRLIRNHFNI